MLRNLLQVITQKNLQLNAKLTHLTQRTTRESCCPTWSEESLYQGRSEFDIPFNRQQLADYLSVNRSAMVPRAVPAPGRGTYPVPAESLRPPAPTGHSLRPP